MASGSRTSSPPTLSLAWVKPAYGHLSLHRGQQQNVLLCEWPSKQDF